VTRDVSALTDAELDAEIAKRSESAAAGLLRERDKRKSARELLPFIRATKPDYIADGFHAQGKSLQQSSKCI
jgi:hypothetical protein